MSSFWAAPKKGDCIICQAPEEVRVAVNMAIWGDGVIRRADYRAAGVRAAAQAATTTGADARYKELDVKTITRHADHIEGSWREINPGERMAESEVPIATDFRSVTTQGARIGALAMQGLEEVIGQNPALFAAVHPKEAIAISKLGLGSVTAVEASKLKSRQQAIDVAALFAASSGHVRPPDAGMEEDVVALDELRAEVAQERALLAARTGG